VPSLGFGAAVFNHQDFNHTYLAGHLSFKTAASEVGYAIGFEQPFFTKTKLFVGVEVHDLTATEDGWRVSPLEASLAAIGPRLSNHDYYERRGVQINAALRVHRQVEFQFAWRDERHEPLFVQSDFSLWNDDEPFRPNLIARPGLLRSLIVGVSIDGEGFDRESLDASYRRHQLEAPFGALLNEQTSKSPEPVWRIDWTSEIASPDVLGGDFDFRRHIISARARLPLSPHQEFGVRGIGGWSQGTLPPQREFAIGGIGSVHGYGFKEAVGDQMVLANLEYWIGWRGGLRATAFFDAGHVSTKAVNTDSPWLKGIGFGVGITDSFRVDFGYKLDEIPSSFQVLWRFSRTW
jgi:surface antigen Omp85-like protein